MNLPLFNKLQQEGFLSTASIENIKDQKAKQLFSLHWELRVILYLGILLLTGGLGILVYKHLDSISHQVVLIVIALLTVICFIYCFRHKHPFSNNKVKSPNTFFDYVLLLGCLCFMSFIAYFQYQYHIFGNRYGLATFFPMLLLFFSAYYFDNMGILSLAITNLAAWVGISVTPLHILQANDFNSNTIIMSSILLGVLLIALGIASMQKKIKPHFEFTYTNFGMHILFIAMLAAMFQFDGIYLVWFLLLMGAAYYFFTRAKKTRSFYMLLVSTIYSYIGISYVVINMLSFTFSLGIGTVYLGFFYFIGSGIAMVLFLMRTNKKMQQNDSLQ